MGIVSVFPDQNKDVFFKGGFFMKKLLSVLLVFSMIILSSAAVFAIDAEAEGEKYALEDLFESYTDFSTAEMLEFIGANPYVANLFYEIRTCNSESFMFYVNLEDAGRLPDVGKLGVIAEKSSEYLLSTARVVNSSDDGIYWNQIGELGNKTMTVELTAGFVDYVRSLDCVEGNNLLLNLVMNVMAAKDVAGIAWEIDNNVYTAGEVLPGDCNGDGAVNSIDGNLMRRILGGKDCTVDPFAVDINGDGRLNAMDSLAVKVIIAG